MKKLLALFAFFFSLCNLQFATAQIEVKIGNQIWMAENLNVEKFRNGDVIPEAKSAYEWQAYSQAEEAAWCYYDNDPINGKKYGKLYNWYAVNDPRGLTPKGWHVPTDKEWTVLTDFLGGLEKVGAKIKSRSGWNEEGNGTNSSGFSGLPSGSRLNNGSFDGIGYYGGWWTSTETNSSIAWHRGLVYNFVGVYRDNSSKMDGFSVRCLRD